MAESLFNIEDSFTEAEKVNDLLFSDVDPKLLEESKKEEEGKKDVKKPESLKKPITPIKKDEEKKDEEEVDATNSLFGDGEEEGKEEEKDEKKATEEEEEDVEEDKEEKSQFAILSEELYNIGVFAPEIDEDGEETKHIAKTPEEFKKLFEYQSQLGMYAMLDNHLSRFGQDRLELFDAVFTKGVDPKEYLPVYNEITDFENLSLETESAQERVVREVYKRSGLSADKIESKIQRLRDISELQAEAEDMKEMLIKQDKDALRKQEEESEAKQKLEASKEAQYKSSLIKILSEKVKAKDFDGVPVSEQTAQKAFDFLYNKKWKGPDGKKFTDFDKFVLELNNPENHALKVKVGLLAQQNFDLSKVQKKAISKESSELFRELASKKGRAQKKQAEAAPWNL